MACHVWMCFNIRSCQIEINDSISSYIITESSKFRSQHAKHAHNHRRLSCWIGFGMLMADHHGWSIIELYKWLIACHSLWLC